MQTHHNDDILSPDYSNPLQYFSSHSLTRTTPPIYADDPWTTSSNASFDFEHNNSNSYLDRELVDSIMLYPDNDQQDIGFGSKLTANNVLLGVDVPDVYNDIYSKSNPYNEKVELKSLQVLLQLAGLSVLAQRKVMSAIASPETTYVTRNEFYAYLACIACGQKNMDISLETIYQHRNDLPVPVFADIESFNIRDQKPSLPPPPPPNSQSTIKEDPWQKSKRQSTDDTSSSTSTAVQQDLIDEHQQLLHRIHRSLYQEEQEAMNQWFRDLDHITVSRTSEKEGFLFKHINYEVESEKMGCKVLRRFSDFWWLWEVLLKRYPYRTMPNLPPKKLGGRDDMFEERRRKGLVRFINGVVRHPVLGRDEVVAAFLSHPSEISSWKRTNSPSIDEEFVRKTHNMDYLERIIPMDIEDRINRMKKRLSISIHQYERMCFIMIQMNRLKKALGTDYVRYSITLNELDRECWVPNCQGCPQVIRGYDSIAKSMHQAGNMLCKQAIATGDSIVESLKRQRDLLDSFRELLDRRERMSPIPNDTLSRQMARYRKGLLQPSIAHDAVQQPTMPSPPKTGLTLVQQRDIFIKSCILAEMSYLHKQQSSVSVMYNKYVRDEVKYARQWNEHWKNLEVMTSEMPNTPHAFL